MSKLSIPHDALVFVGDGQKALFLRNTGDATLLNLTTAQVLTDENPPTHEQGTDRPGRAFQSVAKTKRSGMETTDWHELEKELFARRVAAALEQMVRGEKVKTIVVVAPPRTLAELRNAFHADVKNRIVAEIDKDLTNLPVDQIEKHLAG
jgi:protein required for attachment to host cells